MSQNLCIPRKTLKLSNTSKNELGSPSKNNQSRSWLSRKLQRKLIKKLSKKPSKKLSKKLSRKQSKKLSKNQSKKQSKNQSKNRKIKLQWNAIQMASNLPNQERISTCMAKNSSKPRALLRNRKQSLCPSRWTQTTHSNQLSLSFLFQCLRKTKS